MQTFNAAIEKAAVADVDAGVSGAPLTYVDLTDTVAAGADKLDTTDIHPTEAGYKAIAAALWARIKAETDSTAPVSVAPTNATVLVNGKQVSFEAYAINDYNYVKLRDVGAALDFGVEWGANARAIVINTGTHYIADN